jgi:integrase
MMRQAEEDRIILKSPCFNIRLPSSRRNKRADRWWLTRDELLRLAEAVKPRFRAVVLTMGFMGLRFGEVAGLTVEHLDLLHGTVDIAQSLQEHRGIRLKEPKTKAATRKLPLPKFLIDELGNHVETFASGPYEIEAFGAKAEHRFIFTGEEGGPLRKTWAKRHFCPAAEEANLLPLRPHHLRHTCASLLISRGAREKEVQEWLGHSSYQVTMDVYGHLFPEQQTHLATLLDGLLEVPESSPSGQIAELSR